MKVNPFKNAFQKQANDLGQLARSFSKLMFQGKIHAALQLLEKGGEKVAPYSQMTRWIPTILTPCLSLKF